MEFKLGPHESLTEPSSDWIFDKDTNAQEFEAAMIKFMLDNNGIGLAANQVGISKNFFAMGSKNIPGFEPMGVFNPKILECSQETELFKEGCLSYPDLWLSIKRPKEIVVEYQDYTGSIHTAKIDGLMARVFQHEFDHINGICFVDRVSQMKLQLAMKKLRKSK